ncbi:hypothetical protein VTN00DRAFT_6243 [Thermoascus crustaceus]|uniref:uncharacterized protein n=1 Tax=Thermoascus crustaceus TaxID=5088 RepID=UPI0037438EC6
MEAVRQGLGRERPGAPKVRSPPRSAPTASPPLRSGNNQRWFVAWTKLQSIQNAVLRRVETSIRRRIISQRACGFKRDRGASTSSPECHPLHCRQVLLLGAGVMHPENSILAKSYARINCATARNLPAWIHGSAITCLGRFRLRGKLGRGPRETSVRSITDGQEQVTQRGNLSKVRQYLVAHVSLPRGTAVDRGGPAVSGIDTVTLEPKPAPPLQPSLAEHLLVLTRPPLSLPYPILPACSSSSSRPIPPSPTPILFLRCSSCSSPLRYFPPPPAPSPTYFLLLDSSPAPLLPSQHLSVDPPHLAGCDWSVLRVLTTPLPVTQSAARTGPSKHEPSDDLLIYQHYQDVNINKTSPVYCSTLEASNVRPASCLRLPYPEDITCTPSASCQRTTSPTYAESRPLFLLTRCSKANIAREATIFQSPSRSYAAIASRLLEPLTFSLIHLPSIIT